jgi:hypothetical protein
MKFVIPENSCAALGPVESMRIAAAPIIIRLKVILFSGFLKLNRIFTSPNVL